MRAGEELICHYISNVLPSDSMGVNTATANARLFRSRVLEGISAPQRYSSFSGQAPYSFEDARIRKELDRHAFVTDSMTGLLGKVSVDAMPTVFIYNVLIKPGSYAPQCGQRWINNIAKVTGGVDPFWLTSGV